MNGMMDCGHVPPEHNPETHHLFALAHAEGVMHVPERPS